MIDRRHMITAFAASAAFPFAARSAFAQAAMSRITAYGFSFQGLKGGDIRLADYVGKPLLVVNLVQLLSLSKRLCCQSVKRLHCNKRKLISCWVMK